MVVQSHPQKGHKNVADLDPSKPTGPSPRPPSRSSQRQQRQKHEPLVKIEEVSEIKEEKRSNEILSIGPSFINLQAAPDSDYDENGQIALGDDPLVADDDEELEKEYAEDLTLKWPTIRRPGVRPYDTFLSNKVGSFRSTRNSLPVGLSTDPASLDMDGLPILEAGDASDDDSDSETEATRPAPTTEAEKVAAELAKRTCQQCGVVLSRKFDIPRHMKDTHNDGAPVPDCKYCHKTFKRQDRYNKHMDRVVNGVCGARGRGKQQGVESVFKRDPRNGIPPPNIRLGDGRELSYKPPRRRTKKAKEENRDGVKKAPRKSTNGAASISKAMNRTTVSISDITGAQMFSLINYKTARSQFTSSPPDAFQTSTFYNTAQTTYPQMVPPTPAQGMMSPTDQQPLYHHDNHAFGYQPDSPALMGQQMLSLSQTPGPTPPQPGYVYNNHPQQYFQHTAYDALPLVPGRRNYPGPHPAW